MVGSQENSFKVHFGEKAFNEPLFKESSPIEVTIIKWYNFIWKVKLEVIPTSVPVLQDDSWSYEVKLVSKTYYLFGMLWKKIDFN